MGLEYDSRKHPALRIGAQVRLETQIAERRLSPVLQLRYVSDVQNAGVSAGLSCQEFKMTNQQLYLAVGLPILVNLLTTGLIMLYVNAKVDGIEKALTEKLLRVEQVIDTRLKHLEEK